MDGQVKSMKGNVKWVLILGVKRVSLSLSPSLQKMSADVRIVVCAQFCYMALVVSHHF